MNHRSLLMVFLAAVVLVITTAFTSSCFDIKYANDPTADTPGYRLFTGKSEDLRFSFEYPDEWRRVTKGVILSTRISRWVFIYPDGYSVVRVGSQVTSADGGDFADAGELIEHILDIASTQHIMDPDFQILNRDKAPLGQVEGEEVIYSFQHWTTDQLDYAAPLILLQKPVVARDLVADYGGRIYCYWEV